MIFAWMFIGLSFADPTGRSPAWKLVQRHETPVVIAHRGASILAPENTIAAIEKAVSVGAKAVEFDVRRTADKRLILMHDATLARTTNGRGKVRATPWRDITKLDAGSWFDPGFKDERVPLLAEAFKALGDDAIAAVELKTAEPVLTDLRRIVSQQGATGRVVIFSFKVKQILDSRKLLPNTPALLLIDPDNFGGQYSADLIEKSISIGPDAIGLNESGATERVVNRIQQMGIPVFVYTVDDPQRVARMIELGVDGIISNRPRATETEIALWAERSKNSNNNGH